MANPLNQFNEERRQQIANNQLDTKLTNLSSDWIETSMRNRYVYNFDWLGRPIIQYPQDIVAIQEIIWSTRPDLIIETGIAHGGSLVLSASMLAMLDYCDAIQAGTVIDPKNSNRKVLGLDIDIRKHNRKAIESHPFAHKIDMIEGSSVSSESIEKVYKYASDYKRIMICLDSNHTHEHVLAELNAYANLTSKGCYCVVFDTFVENMPNDLFSNRPWSQGNNPKTAVLEYLKENPEFEIDKNIDNKLMISVAPNGYLLRK